MKSTIRDVARQAEVSVATVSRILNNQSGFTEETRRKVLAVIQEIGYVPNAMARGLATNKSAILGVLLPAITSNFSSALLNGIEQAASMAGYSTLICGTGVYGKDTLQYLRILEEHHVSGILFVSEWVKQEYAEMLMRVNIPIVLIATQSDYYPFPYIKVNDRHAAYQATKYLIDRGHQKIGLISGLREDPVAGVPRLEGYKRALHDAKLTLSDDYVAYGDFAYPSGIRAMEQLYQRVPDITAVFAASDEMAAGALSFAYQHNIRVPDDLSIVGYDDSQIAQMMTPPLTTLHQPIQEMGMRAVQMVLQESPESVTMPFHIVERASVKSLK